MPPIPRPLAALLAVAVVLGLGWALIVPLFQSPDEPSHFAYAQYLAEDFALPGDPKRRSYSTEQVVSDAAVGATALVFHVVSNRPDWSAADDAGYKAIADHGLPRDNGGGPNSAGVNPPLYYLFANLAYWAFYPGGFFNREYAMQIWGVILLLSTIIGGWLLAGEVLGHKRLPQLACAAVCGLMPMETYVSTSITPDALMIPLWTFTLWLGARVIIRRAARRDTAALCAVAAAAILTKGTSYALVPGVLLSLAIGFLRRPRAEHRAAVRSLALALSVLAVPILAWLGLAAALGRAAVNTVSTPAGAHAAPFNVWQFLSYLWQFYLPRLPSQIRSRETSGLPLYTIWVEQAWGVFGWLDFGFASWLYGPLAGITATVALGTVSVLAVIRDRLCASLVAFFGLVTVSLLLGLHLTEYESIIAGEGFIMQGRYLLPLISLFGLAVGLLVTRLPFPARGPACGVILGGLFVLQILALGDVARTYYT